MAQNQTLSQRMNSLRDKGYTEDFNIVDDKLEHKSKSTEYKIDDFKVDEVYRFEGMSNPADNSILFAISTSDGHKGMLVDGYGITSGQVSKEMMNKLNLK